MKYTPKLKSFFYVPAAQPYQPGHRWRSSNDDIGKIYDSATPNPTGSLSGPWIDEGSGSTKNATGKSFYKNITNAHPWKNSSS